MWRGLTLLVVLPVFAGLATMVIAGEEPVYSGPQVGERLAEFRATGVYGGHAGKQFNFVEQAGGKPVLFVFVHNITRPAASLTRALVNYAEMRMDDGLYPAVVWLADDRTAAERYLRQAVAWWGTDVPLGISADGAEGPGSYGLNRNVSLTIVVGDQNRVTANFALVQPSLTDAPGILEEVTALVGGDVPSERELGLLRMSTQLLPRFRQNGIAPHDPRLRALVCGAIRHQDAAAEFDAACTAIEKYVGTTPQKRPQLAAAAKVLTTGRRRPLAIVTARPAVQKFRDWAAEFEPPSAD